MAMVSYGLKITKENHIFDRTIGVYRDAVKYLVEVVSSCYTELTEIHDTEKATAAQLRQQYVERLVHTTQNNTAVYPSFDKRFYKLPSYLRRNAITTAVGKVFAYRKWLADWETNGRNRRRPFLNRTQDVMPCFYRGNTFRQDGDTAEIKLYDGHDWIWYPVHIRNTDFQYAVTCMGDWNEKTPVLTKRNRRYELRIAYTRSNKDFPKFVTDSKVGTVLGVDLGINTDATCSVIRKDGTVAGQKFINSPVEKDRMYGLLNTIKKAQQHGSRKNNRLWRFVDNYNQAVAVKTASQIVDYAVKMKVQVIVFEHLKMTGKKRGNKKQRLALWRKRDIQERTAAMASRHGIRVSHVCAVNTSRLAYDGTGRVLRGRDAGFDTYGLCRFQSGKVYNCDLSASKNIGARYFIRVLLKSVSAKKLLSVSANVPGLDRRTSCTLATLISFHAELCASKTAKRPTKAA